MQANERDDLDFSGVGTASGGIYRDVRFQGVGKIHGDVECVRCVVDGVSDFRGNVKANSVDIRGRAKIEGTVSADEMSVEGATSISGSCEVRKELTIHGRVSVNKDVHGHTIFVDGSHTVGGDLRGNVIKVSGKTHVGGVVSGEEIVLDGSMHVEGSCEAESFRSAGTFKIAGMLNADKISIQLEAKSSAKEIGGGEIRVERGKTVRLLNRLCKLTVDTVEGDDIYLEYTHARVVRGNRVTLGPSTQVDLVEYQTEFHRGEAAVGVSRMI